MLLDASGINTAMAVLLVGRCCVFRPIWITDSGDVDQRFRMKWITKSGEVDQGFRELDQ